TPLFHQERILPLGQIRAGRAGPLREEEEEEEEEEQKGAASRVPATHAPPPCQTVTARGPGTAGHNADAAARRHCRRPSPESPRARCRREGTGSPPRAAPSQCPRGATAQLP
ncbi:unnamed protein product, partial [Prorocentrum cordatum]